MDIYLVRRNNYGCGEEGKVNGATGEGTAARIFVSILVITYALEILFLPTIGVNKVARLFQINIFQRGRVQGNGGKAERFEFGLGIALKTLSCLTLGKAGGQDITNKGELKDFCSHVMGLLDNDVKLDLTLSDFYVGMRMLSRVQGERKVTAVKKMAKGSKESRLIQLARRAAHEGNDGTFVDEPMIDDRREGMKRRASSTMLVLCMADDSYELCKRNVLEESNDTDQRVISEGAHFSSYASYIYVKLPSFVNEFVGGSEDVTEFKRDLDTLFEEDFMLTDIGLENAMLAYSNFVNGIVATPYSIMVDKKMSKIVLVVRG